MTEELLTKAEVAKMLRISPDTLERLMRKKPPLPHIKLDRRVLFRRADIDRWLEKKLIK